MLTRATRRVNDSHTQCPSYLCWQQRVPGTDSLWLIRELTSLREQLSTKLCLCIHALLHFLRRAKPSRPLLIHLGARSNSVDGHEQNLAKNACMAKVATVMVCRSSCGTFTYLINRPPVIPMHTMWTNIVFCYLARTHNVEHPLDVLEDREVHVVLSASFISRARAERTHKLMRDKLVSLIILHCMNSRVFLQERQWPRVEHCDEESGAPQSRAPDHPRGVRPGG